MNNSSLNFLFNTEQYGKSILEFFFGLKPVEVEIYKNITLNGAMNVKQVSQLVARDRSTAYRYLKNLCTTGLIYKYTKTIERGGYFHLYKGAEPPLVRNEILKAMDNWKSGIKEIMKGEDTGNEKKDVLFGLTAILGGEATGFQPSIKIESRSEIIEGTRGKAGAVQKKSLTSIEGRTSSIVGMHTRNNEAGARPKKRKKKKNQIPIHLR